MRDETASDYQERMERVLRFIASHLDEELALEQVAAVAHFSPYHFHRLFRAHYGVSLGRYVRRERMRRAMRLLREGWEVTDVALESGYETPSAFSKAFRKLLGVAPHQFKTKEMNMKPDQIVKRGPIDVVYIRRTGDYQTQPEKAWTALCEYAHKNHLLDAEARCYSIAHDDPHEVAVERLRYDACLATPKVAPLEGEVKRQTIPGGTFAEFTHKGEYDLLDETFMTIYTQWYPTSGVELADGPSYCYFLNPQEMETPERLVTKIFIPIKG